MTIGSVSRPWLPSQNSDRCNSSETGWAAQKSGPTVRSVVSSATALAPFSQNSAGRRRPAGSGQAQPGQSKPPLWLSLLRACAVRRIPACEMPRFSATVTAGIPAAWCFGGLTARSASSISVTGAASGVIRLMPRSCPRGTRRARQSHRVDAWWHHDVVPVYRDSAVVLRVTKLGEADRIVTLLTRREGRVRAVAKGVRRTKSRFGSRLEPFSHVDLQLYAGRNLDIVTQAETLDPFGPSPGRRLLPVHLRDGDRGDRRAADLGGAGTVAPAVPAGGVRVAGADRRPSGTRPWCSTRSCCGRWRWPAGRPR